MVLTGCLLVQSHHLAAAVPHANGIVIGGVDALAHGIDAAEAGLIVSTKRNTLYATFNHVEELLQDRSLDVFIDCTSSTSDESDQTNLRLTVVGDHAQSSQPPNPPRPSVTSTGLDSETPLIFVTDKKEAQSTALENRLLSEPCVVIRNLCKVMQMDLSQFTTRTLFETAPHHEVEIRVQRMPKQEDNNDTPGTTQSWKCESRKDLSTISKYGLRQAKAYNAALQAKQSTNLASSKAKTCDKGQATNRGSTVRKAVRFGTNVDLSDPILWKDQLAEIDKLPNILKLGDPNNMLTHLEHIVEGINTVQLYMKEPGCRTPAHQENLNFCSVNLNIGPDPCEWYWVAFEYWEDVYQLCQRKNVEYLSGSWWPSLSDLREAKIPVGRFVQQPGEVVWINQGTLHWVQSSGWCNNIAWNIAPCTARQYFVSIQRYEFNWVHHYKTIVPIIEMSWSMARKHTFHSSSLSKLVKYTLQVSLRHCYTLLKVLKDKDQQLTLQLRTEYDKPTYCSVCECEVFNLIFIRTSIETPHSYDIFCYSCSLDQAETPVETYVLQQYPMPDLEQIYDTFVSMSSSD